MNKTIPDFSIPYPGGHTMIIDEGLSPDAMFHYLNNSEVGSIKFAYGTAFLYHTGTLNRKINLAHSFKNVIAFTGGTLFEWAHLRKRGNDFIAWAAAVGFSGMEISNTIAGLTSAEIAIYCKRIRGLDMKPLIEIGAKFDPPGAPKKTAALWGGQILMAMEAEPWKIVLEGRASGTAGIFRADGSFEPEAIKALDRFIIDDGLSERFIIEAPQKTQQVELMRRYGLNVGLGNIRPEDVLPVAALRSGLRMDTFPERLNGPGGGTA